MIAGVVCMSHTPLLDRCRAAPDVEAAFNLAVQSAASFVAGIRPELTVVIFPDHLNGFFYDLMPSFCIGLQATSVGDYGTVPGELDVPESIAANCAAFCAAAGVDPAISYKMRVDHGAAQPIELLGGRPTPLVPVFINCVAPPMPTFARVRALGRALGEWAAQRPERILVVASGGLSHDPPIPQMAKTSDEDRQRLINGPSLTHAQRLERQRRVFSVGAASAAGQSNFRPLNPEWDKAAMEAFAAGRLDHLDRSSDDQITEVAGCGGHEIRTWFAALALASTEGPYLADILFYSPIDEWITGTGIMTVRPTRTA